MRSGAFSIAESRSSTKGVLTGAGRASRCRIQALSTAAGCAADGSAIAASTSAARRRGRYGVPGIAPAGLCSGRAGLAWRRVLLASVMLTFAPEIIEVEPVERRIAHMMFKAPCVTADERRHRRRTLAPWNRQAVAERLEHQIVAVAAAVQAER